MPLSTESHKRKLSAILSANAKGYSSLMEDDEAGTLQTLKAHRGVMCALIEKHQGRVLSTAGDDLLAEFASVVDAVRSAIEIQKALKARNEELPAERRMPFGIGVNLGDVIEEGGNIYGDGVNVAARLESLADGGDICISRSVHDQVKNKLDVGYQFLGKHRVEKVFERVQVYRVVLEVDSVRKVVGGIRARLKRWQKVVLASVALLQVIGVVVFREYFEDYFNRATSPPVQVASVEKAALPLPDKPSIVVLPLENLTGDPKQEYFTDGFTDQIITSLSQISSLFVISRTSAFAYKGKPVDLRQVGETLGVRYVLEGSVQQSSRRIRINVKLTDATSDQTIWAESYDRDLHDIFALQDEVILRITSALSVKLTRGEQARVWAQGTKNLEAYLMFMEARGHVFKGSREGIALARRVAEETIALDPHYADAYVLLAYAHIQEVFFGMSKSPKDSIAKGIELAHKALAINDSLADAHSRLGVLYAFVGKHDEGIVEAERGVELDPNSATANYTLAAVLRFAGKSEEALPAMKRALRLEPLAPDLMVQNLALIYFQIGNCKEAIATSERGRQHQPDNLMVRVISAVVYAGCDREEEAKKEAAEIRRINPKFTVDAFAKVLPYKDQQYEAWTVNALRKAGVP